MDSDFLGKVKTLLADPESLERITAIARGLSAPTPAATPAAAPASAAESPAAGTEQPASPTAATPESAAAGPAAAAAGTFARPQSRDSRLTLLEALKPLLREDKRGKIDSLQRAMTMATVLKGLR